MMLMEINFMILWKEKVKEKRNLLQKVTEMVKTIFPNTDSDKVHYAETIEETHLLPYKISSNSSDIVYLKIEYNYSEAKAARILSIVRDKICNGKHRANFSIICTYDEASLSYCCRLMKPFGVFERRLREVMYLTTVKAFGYNWIAKTFPKELIDKIKEKTKGLSDEKLTELAFEYLDYSEISSYLFDERRLTFTPEQAIDHELTDEKLETLSKEEIIDIIRQTRKESLWSRLFSSNEDLRQLEDKIDYFREYRNDTMHHHTMSDDKFQAVKKELIKANKQLKVAIQEMEKKIYTKEEYDSVFVVLGNLARNMIGHFNQMFSSSVVDAIKASYEVMNRAIQSIMLPDTTLLSDALINAARLSIPDMTSLADCMRAAVSLPPIFPPAIPEIALNEDDEGKNKYHVVKIQEEDYGCEGIPDNQELMCNVLVQDEDGNEEWIKISDKYLTDHEIKEGDTLVLPISCAN